MDPSCAELAAMSFIEDVFTWLEMEPHHIAAVRVAFGPSTSLRSWARIPEGRFRQAVADLVIKVPDLDDRKINPMEEGQIGEVRRIALLAMAGQGPPQPTGQAAAGALGLLPLQVQGGAESTQGEGAGAAGQAAGSGAGGAGAGAGSRDRAHR